MKRALLPLALLLLESACSFMPRHGGGYYEDDGPDRHPPDLSRITDAVPHVEPLSAKGNEPYTVFHKTYYPLSTAKGFHERGIASWYGRKFNGKRTSDGETYDMYAMTAANKTLPLPCYVRVRNLRNGRSVIVRVNDRGPFLENRLIDLSYAAAYKLGIVATGTGLVEVDGIDPSAPAVVPVAETGPAGTPHLYVQMGAFLRRENAERLRARLAQAHFSPLRLVVDHKDGAPLYRVRVGPLKDVEASDRVIRDARAIGIHDAIVAID